MKVLAVDTATSRQSVAILGGNDVLAQSDEDAQGAHARHLIATIDRLLHACRLVPTDLDGLAVSIGPGSFTGLRVGLATALGFRLASGLPLVTVPTLEAMAWTCQDSPHRICPVLKARTGEVYWALYQWTAGGRLDRIVEERVSDLEALARALDGPVMMLGEGWRVYRSELRNMLGSRMCDVLDAPEAAPLAVAVGHIGMVKLTQGMVAGPGISPTYVQRTDADLNWERAHAGTSGGEAARRGT